MILIYYNFIISKLYTYFIITHTSYVFMRFYEERPPANWANFNTSNYTYILVYNYRPPVITNFSL